MISHLFDVTVFLSDLMYFKLDVIGIAILIMLINGCASAQTRGMALEKGRRN
jgi:hypothetical protein